MASRFLTQEEADHRLREPKDLYQGRQKRTRFQFPLTGALIELRLLGLESGRDYRLQINRRNRRPGAAAFNFFASRRSTLILARLDINQNREHRNRNERTPVSRTHIHVYKEEDPNFAHELSDVGMMPGATLQAHFAAFLYWLNTAVPPLQIVMEIL